MFSPSSDSSMALMGQSLSHVQPSLKPQLLEDDSLPSLPCPPEQPEQQRQSSKSSKDSKSTTSVSPKQCLGMLVKEEAKGNGAQTAPCGLKWGEVEDKGHGGHASMWFPQIAESFRGNLKRRK